MAITVQANRGTGGETWRELFEAARKFAIESHPDKSFPALGVDAPCPLCQQPLAEGSNRLLRFEAFIQQEAEKTSQARRVAPYAEYKPFAAQVLTLNLDDVTFGEIEALDPQLAADAKAFEPLLAARQEAIKAAVISHQWDDVSQPLVNPTERLQALADKLNAEAVSTPWHDEENSKTAPLEPPPTSVFSKRSAEALEGRRGQSRMAATRYEARGAAREPDGGTLGRHEVLRAGHLHIDSINVVLLNHE